MLPPQLPQLWPPLACVLKFKMCPGPVAGASNPSHLGGRDQEDCSLKQPRQIIHETLSWKYLSLKKSWWSDSRFRPLVQTPVLQKKKKIQDGNSALSQEKVLQLFTLSLLSCHAPWETPSHPCVELCNPMRLPTAFSTPSLPIPPPHSYASYASSRLSLPMSPLSLGRALIVHPGRCVNLPAIV
jgi:hypothetical protein